MTNDFSFAHREEGFDNHIEMSIRGYNNLLDDVINMSRYFVENYTNVVDVGSSTGKMIQSMADQNHSFAPYASYIGIECAQGFKKNMEERIKSLSEKYTDNDFIFEFKDVRNYYFENCSLITSIFTLQFMPMKDRLNVLSNIYKGLNEGGAFIFAEKTIAKDARTQQIITFNYYDYKRKNFTEKDIMDKEITLRNMLKPNSWNEIHDMLYEVGFKTIQPFWQNHLFIGAIALK